MKNELVSPLDDFAFAQIFGSEENLGTTKAFLKTLLDIPGSDYDQLTVKDPTLKRFFKKDKKGVVDLKLTTKSGRIIHIELQVEKETNLRSRIMQYSTRLLSDQLKKGNDYGELHQVVSIVICGHVLLGEEKTYANDYEMRNKEGRSFTDLLKVVILEIPKLPEKEDKAVWPWLQFFKCKEQEEYEMLARKHPELKEAVSCVERMSLSEQWRDVMLYRQRSKAKQRGIKEQIRLDLEEARKTARTEGMAEGLAEGRTEGLAEGIEKGMEMGLAEGMDKSTFEIARNLKKMGLSVSQITEGTGLLPEIIEKL
jgi:predicted transposase/invertase (TIGR01784 family)